MCATPPGSRRSRRCEHQYARPAPWSRCGCERKTFGTATSSVGARPRSNARCSVGRWNHVSRPATETPRTGRPAHVASIRRSRASGLTGAGYAAVLYLLLPRGKRGGGTHGPVQPCDEGVDGQDRLLRSGAVRKNEQPQDCLLYTSDAADEEDSVDLG